MLNHNLKFKGVKIKGEFFEIEEVRKSEDDGYQFINLKNKGFSLGIYSNRIRNYDCCYHLVDGIQGGKDLSKKEVIFVI